MRRRRYTGATLLLIGVLAALPVAGYVQHRWLSEAARGVATQLQQSLLTAARQLRTVLGVEEATLATLLSPTIVVDDETPTALSADTVAGFIGSGLAAWSERSRFPGLYDGAYLVTRSGDGSVVVSEFDRETSTFSPLSAADPVVPLLITRQTLPRDRTSLDVLSFVDIPIRLTSVAVRDRWFRVSDEIRNQVALVVAIDVNYLATRVIPTLVDDLFGSDLRYDIVVRADDGRSVLYSTLAGDDPRLVREDTVPPDALVQLWEPGMTLGAVVSTRPLDTDDRPSEPTETRLQEPIVQQWMSLFGNADAPAAQFSEAQPDALHYAEIVRRPGVTVSFWHPAGSITRAATLDRNRNLVASYAVLGLLAGVTVGFYLLFMRASRLREREQEFVATVTHELRTPVAAMYAASENLAEGIVTRPGQVEAYGRSLLAEGRRLRMMIDQVLLYAGLRGGPRPTPVKAVNIPDVVRSVVDRVPEVAPDRVGVTVDQGLDAIVVDQMALESILVNLLSNAGKHNDAITRITVDVRVEASRGRRMLAVTVSDNGRGIPRRELAQVIVPFYRGSESADRQVPGSGLGLSLVQRMVATFGGTLRIESTVGEGTTVFVRLPVGNGYGT